MAEIIEFLTPAQASARLFVRENRSDRPTREIIDELKPLRLFGEQDAIARNTLFAELAVKSERGTT